MPDIVVPAELPPPLVVCIRSSVSIYNTYNASKTFHVFQFFFESGADFARIFARSRFHIGSVLAAPLGFTLTRISPSFVFAYNRAT